MLDPPSLRVLVARLVRYLNERVHSGDLTERGLARLTGYSQPHIHNVLKGARGMRIELADHIMALLGIPLSALLTQNEIAGQEASRAGMALPVPILEGPLGAGAPFPRETVSMERRLFPSAQLDGLIRPRAGASPSEGAVDVASDLARGLRAAGSLAEGPPETPFRTCLCGHTDRQKLSLPLPRRGPGACDGGGQQPGSSRAFRTPVPVGSGCSRYCPGPDRLAGPGSLRGGVSGLGADGYGPDLNRSARGALAARRNDQRLPCPGCPDRSDSGTAADRIAAGRHRCDRKCRPGYPRNSPRPGRR